jgi:type 2 lantibiotic biosynthesis protein LanM
MDAFYNRLAVGAATVDELLSDDFEVLPGQKADAELAARRLAAWCRSSASGDWSLFERRLKRDGLSSAGVLAKFATVRRKPDALPPAWIEDAIRIAASLESPAPPAPVGLPERRAPGAFEHLLMPVIGTAEALLRSRIDARTFDRLEESALADLRRLLLEALSDLCAPALYERFGKARMAADAPPGSIQFQPEASTRTYDRFVADMKSGGFRRLFEDKPVLLRLMASLTRQWIDATHEFLMRLDADADLIRQDLLHSPTTHRVAGIEGQLADPHNHGRSVHVLVFADDSRIVYKPKDLRLDAAWHALVERLNGRGAPLDLQAVRTLVRDGYGWTEFIPHAGCTDPQGCRRFFRRAGAWLALFHGFAATDMHQENMIAAGEHPVPIDLEMILQATAEEHKTGAAEAQAFEAAMTMVFDSVMTVGLLPSYGKSPGGDIYAIGGVTSDWTTKTKLTWTDVNTDGMRPAKTKEAGKVIPNLPHAGGRYARLSDHLEDLVTGFEDYARFLLKLSRDGNDGGLFAGFAGLPVRKVVRPTRFYAMLLQRLRDHRHMEDGVIWSAQADFAARLADWEREIDPAWPLQRAERAALLELNVPHFLSPSDRDDIRDVTGIAARIGSISGLDRARERVRRLDEQEIAWQVEIIRQNTGMLSSPAEANTRGPEPTRSLADTRTLPTREAFLAEAGRIAEELSRRAIRRDSSAAWIGLDWLGDSEVSRLVALGPELYNGTSGIALFLAGHAAATGDSASRQLALAAVSHLRQSLKGRNSARMARSLGLGAASGMGSVVYALTVMSKLLDDRDLLADAHAAANLITDDLVEADKQLDVMGGSAGGILGLLRLYRQDGSAHVLERAEKCGRHLLAQRRSGAEGARSWAVPGSGPLPLNGMSHGAAGFAYALAALADATGDDAFAEAAAECIAYENASYDAEHNNWPDLRASPKLSWPCQWCRGAPGVGLARIATIQCGMVEAGILRADIGNALAGAERGWPRPIDTLCCGTLGSIEFFSEAGAALDRPELRDRAAQRLAAIVASAAANGDYRWNTGRRDFNVGLYRGLAGVGYTLLRQVDESLPNVLTWE